MDNLETLYCHRWVRKKTKKMSNTDPTKQPRVNPGAREGLSVPASYMSPSILIIQGKIYNVPSLYYNMIAKLYKFRSTIPSISTKRTITSHLESLNTHQDNNICHYKFRSWFVKGIQYDVVKPVNGITTTSS
jgi:hypothetical protein